MPDVIPAYHDRVRHDVLDIVPAQAGRLLDFGGGIGATGAMLKATGRAGHVVLVDQVADSIAEGVDQAFVGNAEDAALIDRIQAEAGLFDTILCLDILEHLRDPWAVVRRLHQVVRPGGCIVISVPNVNHLSVVAPLVLRGRFDLKDAGVLDRTHLRWFAKHGAIELATGSGLVLEKLQSNVYGRRNKLLNWFTLGLLNRFLAVQYVVRVRRPEGSAE